MGRKGASKKEKNAVSGPQPRASMTLREEATDANLFFNLVTIVPSGLKRTTRVSRRRHKKSDIAIQNNVVYNCHFCSHRNLMRGTPKGYVQEISPPKTTKPSRLDDAYQVVERSTSLTQSTPPTAVKANNKMDAVAFPISDRQSLEPSSPSTPLPTTGLYLLDAKRRKRNRPSAKKAAEPKGSSNAADAEKSRCTSSKWRKKSWTGLKEIAQNSEHDTVERFTKLTIPFFM